MIPQIKIDSHPKPDYLMIQLQDYDWDGGVLQKLILIKFDLWLELIRELEGEIILYYDQHNFLEYSSPEDFLKSAVTTIPLSPEEWKCLTRIFGERKYNLKEDYICLEGGSFGTFPEPECFTKFIFKQNSKFNYYLEKTK